MMKAFCPGVEIATEVTVRGPGRRQGVRPFPGPGRPGLAAAAADPVIPIVGARRLEQFRDNLACLDLNLGEDQFGRLDAASHVALGFPHDFFANEFVKGLVYGGMRDKIDA